MEILQRLGTQAAFVVRSEEKLVTLVVYILYSIKLFYLQGYNVYIIIVSYI